MIVPPWPSKTANKALPSPISTSWMAASYMFFLQPSSWFLYLAFQLNRRKSSLNYLSKCFFPYLVPTNIRPSIISEYNLNIISYLSISFSINNHSSHQPKIFSYYYFSYPSSTLPSMLSIQHFQNSWNQIAHNPSSIHWFVKVMTVITS